MRIYIKRAIIILFVMLIVVTYLVCNLWNTKTKETALFKTTKVIVLDPGHGGFDGGAKGSNSLEKDINLAVSLKLRDSLLKRGYVVYMTRDEDIALSGEGGSTKKADMYERRRIMNETNADIFISIHMNLFPDSKYKGAQVFYSKNKEESMHLAKNIQDCLRNEVDVENKREIKKAEDSIFLMKHAKIPACVVECGFLSNKEEEMKLLDTAYQTQISESIANGVDKYFQEQMDNF